MDHHRRGVASYRCGTFGPVLDENGEEAFETGTVCDKTCFAREVVRLTQENERFRAALAKIAKWFGEFPETGRTLDDGSPMSFGVCNGSNGERDYMRQVARDALG